MIIGPPDTPYEGGIFKAMMQFPDDFPNSPPEMQFISKMYHPNGPCALRLTYARVSHALVLMRACLAAPALPSPRMVVYLKGVAGLTCETRTGLVRRLQVRPGIKANSINGTNWP